MGIFEKFNLFKRKSHGAGKDGSLPNEESLDPPPLPEGIDKLSYDLKTPVPGQYPDGKDDYFKDYKMQNASGADDYPSFSSSLSYTGRSSASGNEGPHQGKSLEELPRIGSAIHQNEDQEGQPDTEYYSNKTYGQDEAQGQQDYDTTVALIQGAQKRAQAVAEEGGGGLDIESIKPFSSIPNAKGGLAGSAVSTETPTLPYLNVADFQKVIDAVEAVVSDSKIAAESISRIEGINREMDIQYSQWHKNIEDFESRIFQIDKILYKDLPSTPNQQEPTTYPNKLPQPHAPP